MEATIVLLLCVLLVAGQLWLDKRSGVLDVFDVKYLFQLYYIIQLPVIAVITMNFNIDDYYSIPVRGNEEVYRRVLGLILLGSTAFTAGYLFMRKYAFRVPEFIQRPWHAGRAWAVVAVLVVMGYLAFLQIIRINGGFDNFMQERESWRSIGMIGQGFLIFPATSLLGVASIISVILYSKSPRNRIDQIRAISVLLASTGPAIILGFRGLLFLPLVQVLVAFHFSVKRINLLRMAPIIALVALVFTGYGLLREAGAYGLEIEDIPEAVHDLAVSNPELFFAPVMRSRGANVLAQIVRKLDSTDDFQLGVPGLIETSTIVIPKALWDGKPEPSSVIFSQTYFGTTGGVSPTILGHCYINFGTIGVLVGMLVMGALMAMLFNTLRAYPGGDSVLLLYAVLMTSLAMFAEAPQGYLNGLVLYAFALIPFFYFVSRKS